MPRSNPAVERQCLAEAYRTGFRQLRSYGDRVRLAKRLLRLPRHGEAGAEIVHALRRPRGRDCRNGAALRGPHGRAALPPDGGWI